MNARDLIRHLAYVAHRHAKIMAEGAKRHPHLGPLLEALSAATGEEDPRSLPPEAWEEGLWKFLVEAIAETIAEGWDRYGAPSAARNPEGWYIASAQVGPEMIHAWGKTKREAYREARRAWAYHILNRGPR